MKITSILAMAAFVATASAQFVTYSRPNFRGRSQQFKQTPGCYQLDGSEVASFEGVATSRYTFYRNGGCGGRTLFTSNSSPVKRISPAIRPRSVKILEGREHSRKVTLVTYPKSRYSGKSQSVKGTGCARLNGAPVSSFKGYGGYRYKFYPDRGCHSTPVLQSKGGDKANTRTIYPGSVYIYKNK
ncbi:hypothetical protein BGZ76_002670 [Entomortierella beljakovae]|nr:hypothetical protein BGZ76_002670 [Entomortierella beljakovae]